MSTPLRPLTTAELLDRTFHLYRNNFMLFAGIATIAAVSLLAGSLLLAAMGNPWASPEPQLDPNHVARDLAIYFGVLGIFYVLGGSLAAGATTYAVSKVHLDQPVSISESYGKVFPRLGRMLLLVLVVIGRLIGMLLLGYLCLFVVGILLGLILAGVGGRGVFIASYIVGAVGGLAVYVFTIRLYLQYAVAIQVFMLEGTGATDSVNRSKFLTRDYLWRTFLIYLLMGVIGFALGFVLHVPARVLRNPFLFVFIWQFLSSFVATTLSFPISTIATSLLYYDLRVRKEALDIQLMMESVNQLPQASATSAPMG